MTRVSLYNLPLLLKQRSHPHHPQNPIAYFLHQKQSPLHHPQSLIAYFLKSNSDRLNYGYFILMLIRYNISDKFAKEGQIYD
jgi:hypothetical protein